mmetsp:Transcript_12624/g.36854  ORF Transcript_12624/g.36854 Transcript_12624/m.36854 type:complete len:295 (-) Transcript_12624:261-1145(-)
MLQRRPVALPELPHCPAHACRVPDAVRHRQRRRHDAGGGSAARRAGRDVCAARLAAAGAAPGRGRQPRAGATPALARNADARAARVAVTAAGLALCDARSGGARPAGGQHDGRRARPFAQPESERVGAGHGAGVACAAARSAGRHGPGTWVDAAGAGAHAQHVHEPSGQHRRGAVGVCLAGAAAPGRPQRGPRRAVGRRQPRSTPVCLPAARVCQRAARQQALRVLRHGVYERGAGHHGVQRRGDAHCVRRARDRGRPAGGAALHLLRRCRGGARRDLPHHADQHRGRRAHDRQ